MLLLNETVLVLISKVKNNDSFVSVSLNQPLQRHVHNNIKGNVQEIQLVLPDIIAEEQSGFVPGKLITDKIIIAYECLHYEEKQGYETTVMCFEI